MKPVNLLRPSQRQAGFTLVELVTVILILGVLAAVALPRFADLGGQARTAKVKAIAGSVQAAAGLAKSAAMAGSVSCSSASGTSVTLEGTSIALNYCYPQALGSFSTGVLAAANVQSADSWQISSTAGFTGGATGGSAVRVELTDAGTPGNCAVTYTSPSAANGAPTVSYTTSGC